MTGAETLIAILGVAAIVAGACVWKAYIARDARRLELDHWSRISVEETRRLEIIAALVEKCAPSLESWGCPVSHPWI